MSPAHCTNFLRVDLIKSGVFGTIFLSMSKNMGESWLRAFAG